MTYYKYNGAQASETAAPTKSYYGTPGKDTLTGTNASEALWGSNGDKMTGGAGDDTYYVTSGGDQVIELGGGGVDKIVAWMNIDLANFANVENLYVSGDNTLTARGNDLDNIIEGGAGSQILYGGLGQDVLIGGGGKDTFVVVKGEGNDVIQDFTAAEDKVRLTSTYATFADVKANLTQVGADVRLDLGGGDGLLFRNLTVDKLTASHFDLSVSAAGSNDAASKPSTTAPAVTAPVTPVVETPVAGSWLATAQLRYDGTAGAQTGAATKSYYGTAGKDTLTGTNASEALWGSNGDKMIGGGGDDTYYITSSGDQVVELAGGGTDKIIAWMSIDLANFANVENLYISGDNTLTGRGNDLDNIIEGGAGSQILYGGKGQDILIGGAGKDTFVVVKGEGNDVIQDFTVADDKVKLTSDYKTFAQVQSHLTQVGADVRLDLGGGDNLLFRNLTVDKLTASHFELPGAVAVAPTAPVVSQPQIVIPSPILTVPDQILPTVPTGSSDLGSTAAAVATADASKSFYGSSAAESISGTNGADALWGNGRDTLAGGAGDDTYYYRGNEKIIEHAGGGNDKIVAWTNIDLRDFANIENASVSGDKLYVAGNNLSNVLQGGDGAQQIYGGGGLDVLTGGAGKDTFIVIKGEGNDTITDFSVKDDTVRLTSDYKTFAQVQSHMVQVGADVRLDLGGSDALLFKNATVGSFTANNFDLPLNVANLKTTFAEEFTSTLSLWDRESNPTGIWRPDYGYGGVNGADSYTLTNNGEKAIYTSPYYRGHNGDFSETPFVNNADGTLSIWARPSTNSEIFGYNYTSGLITTKESFAQTYGYFEMRADLPEGSGVWPAFWLLPKDGSWPPELDVMETLGGDVSLAYTTAHSGVTGHTQQGQANYIPETADGMHTYGVMWTPEDLIWYIDGVEVFRADTPADMNKPMYMLANLALGGWAGSVDASATPAEFQIDYIRAYELPSNWAVI